MLGVGTAFRQLQEATSLIESVKRMGKAVPTLQATLDPFLLQEETATARLVLEDGPMVRALSATDRRVKVSLDGTCRKIRCPYASQFIATAAICTRNMHPIADYPTGPWNYPIKLYGEYRWIGLLPRLEAEIRNHKNTRVFPAGYDEKQAYTELRAGLETWLLEEAVPTAVELLEELGATPLVVLDGCVYFVPRSHLFDESFYSYSQLHYSYASFYAEDIGRRIKAVDALAKRGVPVVGVVKQTHHSNLLLKNPYITDYARALGLRPELFTGDWVFTLELFRQSLSHGFLSLPEYCIATAPMEINYAEKGIVRGREFSWLRKLLERNPKVYVYLGVLGHPFSEQTMQVYRLETTEAVYRRFGEELWSEVLGDTTLAGMKLPSSLLHSHRRCISWATTLRNYAETLMARRGIPVEPETLLPA